MLGKNATSLIIILWRKFLRKKRDLPFRNHLQSSSVKPIHISLGNVDRHCFELKTRSYLKSKLISQSWKLFWRLTSAAERWEWQRWSPVNPRYQVKRRHRWSTIFDESFTKIRLIALTSFSTVRFQFHKTVLVWLFEKKFDRFSTITKEVLHKWRHTFVIKFLTISS